MRIECAQEKLASAVSITERIAGKHTTLPVLSCLLFESKKNELVIKATNLDLGIEISIATKSNEEGIVAVPASILNSFISSIPKSDENIKITKDEGNVKIETSHSKGTIKSMMSEDSPSIPRIQEEVSFKLMASDFVRGLKSVWYSCSLSGIKPELSSVYILSSDDSITFAATDSFRLAEKRIKAKKGLEFGQILLPFKNITEIIRIFEKVNEEVEVHLSKNQISFEYKGIYLVSRVVDGTFPDYKQIIPKQSTTEVIVLKQDLINALKTAHIFSDKFNQITVSIDPKEKSFELKTKNSDVGENTQNIEATLTGEPITISFNYKYIMDCFQSIEADSITMLFSGLNRPMIIRSASDTDFTYLIMPMNR